MKQAIITLLFLNAFLKQPVAGQREDNYLEYGVPHDAQKLGPLNTRNPRKKWFNYFLPGQEPSRKMMIARETYDDGHLVERKLYKDGLEHGIQREWHPNGKLKKEAPYLNGVMHGVFRHWDEAGHLIGRYLITRGAGTRVVYNPRGELAREENIASNEPDGLCMELLRSGGISIWWQKNGHISRGFSFYADGGLMNLTLSSSEDTLQGIGVSFTHEGAVASKQWFFQNGEISEKEYEKAASSNPTLPAYYKDVSRYKEFVDAEVKALLEKYRELPRVKIPLEFDQAGNPVLAP